MRIIQCLRDIRGKLPDIALGQVILPRTDQVGQAVQLLHADQIGIALKLAVLGERLQLLVLIGHDIGAVLHLIQHVRFLLRAFLRPRDLRLLLLVVVIRARGRQRDDFQNRSFGAVHAL